MPSAEIYSDMIVIENVILDWPHLWEPHTPPGASKASYSCVGLVDETTAQIIWQKAQEVATARFKNNEHQLQKFQWPVVKAAEKQNNDGSFPYRDNPRTQNLYVISASDGRNAPQVVDQNRQLVIDRGQIYAGCVVALGIRVGTYNTAGNIGIRCNLHAVMKMADGEPLGDGMTNVNPETLFAGVQAQQPAAAPASLPGGAPAPQQPPAAPFGQPTQAPAQGMPAAPFQQPPAAPDWMK